jgi:hypothetical protein
MWRAALPSSAFLAFAACAATALAPIQNLPRDSRPPADCTLEVRFGSICCGPDAQISDRIRAAAQADPRVAKAYAWAWGEEGETSLCLALRRHADGATLAHDYRAWIAARPQPVLTTVELR